MAVPQQQQQQQQQQGGGDQVVSGTDGNNRTYIKGGDATTNTHLSVSTTHSNKPNMRTLVVVAAVVAVVSASPIGFSRAGVGLIGRSGIVTVDGRIIPFTPEFMDDIVEIGEAGIVTKSGKNVHLTLDLQRTKRDVTNGFTRPNVGSINHSGAVLTDGTIIQFSPEFIEDILYFGESGIITKSGKNVQLTADLKQV